MLPAPCPVLCLAVSCCCLRLCSPRPRCAETYLPNKGIDAAAAVRLSKNCLFPCLTSFSVSYRTSLGLKTYRMPLFGQLCRQLKQLMHRLWSITLFLLSRHSALQTNSHLLQKVQASSVKVIRNKGLKLKVIKRCQPDKWCCRTACHAKKSSASA